MKKINYKIERHNFPATKIQLEFVNVVKWQHQEVVRSVESQ